ncbi:CRISPR-associated protein Csx14 [Methanospirillum sp. J.3.6.1-F.2.7.3]|jgi:CRISPR-associated protein Csx14|uniref:CRISPR-associated protein Csx14 n=1 Tax=Methanospirillum purgamenti TaxID=2834276 RepID=A0A8E7EGY7_9EURY|nr:MULTISPECIES: CRISPR-associated protein Csx14 [Methanospirillum]MDX8551956.1 CRISPR-associated protein Csx14 [Methanospirillum hungatei]QVV88377.1 CRISPR-associated protein Csx14 [Methanospirillum sp. J.3.6.1-F.2.7.3]
MYHKPNEKTAVIAPIGTSPPVITAGIDAIDEPVSDLVLLSTQDEQVLAGCQVVSLGLKSRYPHIRVHFEYLPFDDISSDDENLKFMAIAARVIKKEREEFGCGRILLNVAGGRKNMCITLALLGQLLNVDGVFHIVNHEVKLFNQHLERIRPTMMRLFRTENEEEKSQIYHENQEMFEFMLFPPRNEYELIRIPTLPYPVSFISSLLSRVVFDPYTLNKEDCSLLLHHGILEQNGNNLYISDYGAKFLDVLVGKG